MIDIAPPVSIIDPILQHKTHHPCWLMLSVTLTPSLRCQRHQRPPSRRPLMRSHLPPISIINALRRSLLFAGPPRSSSVRFVDDHTLRPRPLSVRIHGTTFLYFSAELMPQIGTQYKIYGNKYNNQPTINQINTTINHGRRTTRAQTNVGAVMGMDGNGEESKITIEEIEMKYGNKYNNQPQR